MPTQHCRAGLSWAAASGGLYGAGLKLAVAFGGLYRLAAGYPRLALWICKRFENRKARCPAEMEMALSERAI